MTAERFASKGLLVAAALAALVLGTSALARFRPLDFATCRQQLADGDLEGDERRARLVRLCAVADPGVPVERMAAALACVALEDLPGFFSRCGTAPSVLPVSAQDVAGLDAASCDTAAFGDDVLRRLLDAFCAEARGDRDTARTRYAQLQQSARLHRMAAAGELCAQGLARLR